MQLPQFFSLIVGDVQPIVFIHWCKAQKTILICSKFTICRMREHWNFNDLNTIHLKSLFFRHTLLPLDQVLRSAEAAIVIKVLLCHYHVCDIVLIWTCARMCRESWICCMHACIIRVHMFYAVHTESDHDVAILKTLWAIILKRVEEKRDFFF